MKKRLTLFVMAILAVLTAQAQVIAYEVQKKVKQDPPAPTVVDLQGTTGKDLSKVLLDADGNINFNAADDVTAFPIGFDFGYNGYTMKYFLLEGDGAVLLSPTEKVSTAVHVLGTTAAANILTSDKAENMFGAIVRTGSYGLDDTEISYVTSGEEGNRVLTICYKNMGIQSNSWNVETEAAKVTLEYKIYEATGNIEMCLSGYKPYADVGNYNFIRIGIVGDKGDWLFLSDYEATSLSQKDANIAYNAESYPADGTIYTFVAPEPCQTPAEAPTALALTSTTTQIAGTFTFGSADHYLVLVSKESTLTEQPTDKTKYKVGDQLGNAEVVAIVAAADGEAAFTTPGSWQAEAGQSYNVFVYGYNSLCSAGPLYNATAATASAKMKPAAPTALTTANADKNTMQVSVEAAGTVLVAMTQEQGTDRWGDPAPYGAFGQPQGNYSVGDEIDGGGKVIFVGSPAEAISLDGLVAGTPYFFRAWSTDGEGGYSSEYVDAIDVTAGVLPWNATFDERVGYEAFLPGWVKDDADLWSSQPQPDKGYIYSNITYIENAEQGVDTWIESPYIYMGEEGTKMKFSLGGSGGFRGMSNWTLEEGDKVVVQVTADGTNYTDVFAIDNTTVEALSRSELTPFTFSFTELAGQKARLRILAHRNTTGQVRIGSISLDVKSDCEAPTAFSLVGLEGSTAVVGWTPAAEEDAWEVSYKKAADEAWSDNILVQEPKVALTGLSGATAYEVRVRSLCSAEKKSAWSDPFTFKTGYIVPFETNLATDDLADWAAYAGILSDNTELMPGGDVLIGAGRFGGSNHVYQPNDESYSWLVTPSISLGSDATAEYEVSFTYTTNFAIVNPESFEIKAVVAQDGENFSSSNVLGTISLEEQPAEGEQKTFTFPLKGFSGNVRIGFYFAGKAQELPWLILDKVGMKQAEGPQDVSYKFVATEWIAGDAGRISPDKVVANADNTITVSQEGQNNVALLFRSSNVYEVPAANRYFVIKATGLSTADGASYLWWLNNTNNGSQIAPSATYTEDGQTVFAWDCATISIGGQLGITDTQFKDEGGWSTTFGMTLADASVPAVISYIGFQESIAEPVVENAYQWDPNLWVAGDPGRISPSNVVVDQTAKTITVDKTGDNNVALLYKTDQTLYVEGAKYFVIKGKGLSTAEGKSYLWWLNNTNNGSQVAPTKIVEQDGETIFSWTIAETGLGASFEAARTYLVGTASWNTTFGLTLADDNVPAVISYIGFDKDDITTGVQAISNVAMGSNAIYNLQGVRVDNATKGLYIVNGKKTVVK